MPWYKQKTSWVGIAMIAGSLGGYIEGSIKSPTDLLYGIVAGVAFIVLQGATVAPPK